ncbi:MAG: hypothetical protein M3O29_04410 [Actinomycetota bacterium]|nr:hypothetical protein [Actinomycetota bacterium]
MNLVEGVLHASEAGLEITFGGHTLSLDPGLVTDRPALQRYVDRQVIVGVRPGDLEDAALYPDAPTDRRLKTTVELREDMGAEILVHFTVDAPPVAKEEVKQLAVDRGEVEDPADLAQSERSTFIASFDADSTAAEGDRIEVLVDTRALQFFDPETSVSIWQDQ